MKKTFHKKIKCMMKSAGNNEITSKRFIYILSIENFIKKFALFGKRKRKSVNVEECSSK